MRYLLLLAILLQGCVHLAPAWMKIPETQIYLTQERCRLPVEYGLFLALGPTEAGCWDVSGREVKVYFPKDGFNVYPLR